MQNFLYPITEVAEKIEKFRENIIVYVEPHQIKETVKLLILQNIRFVHLTAIDFSDKKNKIELNYFFLLLKDKVNIVLKVYVDSLNPTISSISDIIPAAIWAERECNDLFGVKFEGHPDPRRLVLSDDWPEGMYPLRKDFKYNQKPPQEKKPFLLKKPKEGTTVIPIGPFYPSLEEPAYFRLIVEGEKIIDFDYRGFYVHRGIEKLAESALNYQQIPFLAERICGICGFVHSTCYCQAVEKAADIDIPQRAKFIRSMFLELERIHSHLLWIGLAAHIIGFDTLFMQTWRIREPVMYMCEIITGNRKTYGINIVGGVIIDVLPQHLRDLENIISDIEKEIKELREIILEDDTIQLRFKNVGILEYKEAEKYSVCGPVARASGIKTDMRVDFPYAAYPTLSLRVPTKKEGDIWARTLIRLDEILISIGILKEILTNIPEGSTSVKVSKIPSWKEAISYVEAPRGQLFHYILTGPDGKPYRWAVRAPSYQNYQCLSILLQGATIADAPLIIGSIDPCFSCTERYEILDIKNKTFRIYSLQELECLKAR